MDVSNTGWFARCRLAWCKYLALALANGFVTDPKAANGMDQWRLREEFGGYDWWLWRGGKIMLLLEWILLDIKQNQICLRSSKSRVEWFGCDCSVAGSRMDAKVDEWVRNRYDKFWYWISNGSYLGGKWCCTCLKWYLTKIEIQKEIMKGAKPLDLLCSLFPLSKNVQIQNYSYSSIIPLHLGVQWKIHY